MASPVPALGPRLQQHRRPQRHQDGAEAIERQHQRRMVSLRADGVIAILCPVLSDTTAGIAVMTVPVEQVPQIMAQDPCVRAAMMTYEAHSCLRFPGDSLPGRAEPS
jgi:hypothetical protein